MDNKVIGVLRQLEESESTAIYTLLFHFLANGTDTVALRRDGELHLAHMKTLRTRYISDSSDCASAIDAFSLLQDLLHTVQGDLDAFAAAYPPVHQFRTIDRL